MGRLSCWRCRPIPSRCRIWKACPRRPRYRLDRLAGPARRRCSAIADEEDLRRPFVGPDLHSPACWSPKIIGLRPLVARGWAIGPIRSEVTLEPARHDARSVVRSRVGATAVETLVVEVVGAGIWVIGVSVRIVWKGGTDGDHFAFAIDTRPVVFVPRPSWRSGAEKGRRYPHRAHPLQLTHDAFPPMKSHGTVGAAPAQACVRNVQAHWLIRLGAPSPRCLWRPARGLPSRRALHRRASA